MGNLCANWRYPVLCSKKKEIESQVSTHDRNRKCEMWRPDPLDVEGKMILRIRPKGVSEGPSPNLHFPVDKTPEL